MGWLRQGGAALSAAGALPVAAAALALRPDWRSGFSERLGLSGEHDAGAVWLHGASVGESMLLARLAPALRKEGHRVQATLTSATGAAALRRALPDLPVRLAPLDHPWSVDAALGAMRPSALLLFETELWPVLIAGAHARAVPVALVSARISDRAFRGYRVAAPFFAGTLGRIDRIGARSEADADRFVALGADPGRVRVTGDLKDEPAAGAPDSALAGLLGSAPILVAGSTHEGEERAVLAAFEACCAEALDVALVLAPRHRRRLSDVEAVLRASGRRWWRRSEAAGRVLGPGEVLLLDTHGELAGLYHEAALAFVGGTLAPVGGHNLMEPVQAGCPVIFGPHVENVRDAAGQLEGAGVGRRVQDEAELSRACIEGLRAAGHGRRPGAPLVPSDGGRVLARTLDLVREILPEPVP